MVLHGNFFIENMAFKHPYSNNRCATVSDQKFQLFGGDKHLYQCFWYVHDWAQDDYKQARGSMPQTAVKPKLWDTYAKYSVYLSIECS